MTLSQFVVTFVLFFAVALPCVVIRAQARA